MALTMRQIESIVAQAKADGMTPDEADGLLASLLNRAADLSAEDKLRLAIDDLSEDERGPVDEFLSDFNAMGDRIKSRGRAALEALSDDEWERLVDESIDDGDPNPAA